jgi:hypothetical protein
MGVEAFAERAARELRATGETARKRTVDTRDELTAGRPRAAARSSVVSEVQATRIGGWGRVTGRGTTATSRKRKNSPSACTRAGQPCL